jgi:hypothetical protein
MKLYNVPRNTRVKLVETGDEFLFHRVDGMYSYCTDEVGNVIHLAAFTEVEIINPQENGN